MHAKHRGLIISSFLAIIFMVSLFIPNHVQSSTSSWNWEISSGLNILIVTGDAFYSNAAAMNTIKETYEAAGTNVTVVESYNFANFASSGYNALLISAIEGDNWFNAANLTNIVNWFNDGNKLLWVAGDSDYGGYYQSNSTSNPVLEAVKSNLRIDGGAIEDPESNDGSAYRVIANESGVSSPLTDYVAGDFVSTIFHGPTAVNFYDYTTSEYKDLRLQNIGTYNIDIILNSSSAANALDQDASIKHWDYYPWSNYDYGSFPMLATQQVNGSIVVASGEVMFSNYKFMYDYTYEKTETTHDGAKVVDKLLDYWFIQLNNEPNAILVERPFLTSISTTTVTTTSPSTIISTIRQTQTETQTDTQTETLTETQTETYTETYTEENNSTSGPQVQLGSNSLLGYTLIALTVIVATYRKQYQSQI